MIRSTQSSSWHGYGQFLNHNCVEAAPTEVALPPSPRHRSVLRNERLRLRLCGLRCLGCLSRRGSLSGSSSRETIRTTLQTDCKRTQPKQPSRDVMTLTWRDAKPLLIGTSRGFPSPASRRVGDSGSGSWGSNPCPAAREKPCL